MDIPFPDELELLEAESNFLGNEDDYRHLSTHDPYPPEEDDDDRNPETLTINVNNNNQNQNSLPTQSPPSKRALTDASDSPSEKRTRIDVPAEVDDDWLRYTPPVLPHQPEVVEVAVEEKLVSRFASEIDGDFVTVTDSNGDRVYVKICRVESELRSEKLDVKSLSRNEGLISEPVSVLLQKVEQEAFTKAVQASSKGQVDVVFPELPPVHEQLWVDKYAPNTFTELLSDEQTNREVLLWLKQWDSCVFGSEVRSTSDDVLSSLKRHSSVSQHQRVSNTNFMRKNRGPSWSNERSTDSHNLELENGNKKGIHDIWQKKTRHKGPPEHKILMLCGSPGLGKTTLAHVAAKHCGYRVVEINASDDRSSSTIEAKILDVVQMNSVTADTRPKCLVIDEIDGALGDGKGAVEVILKMVSAERKSDTKGENVTIEERTGRTSKKGRKITSLSRPVICICNDLYAPALRPLRQVARVHTFVQPTISRVVSRLKYICNKEQMKTSSIALTALAEYTECDIRSCLNTLQFLNKKNETLNVMEISSQVVGKKDMSRSAFDVWKEIFQIRKMKQRSSNRNCSSVSNEFESLQSLISNRGDYDTIMDGIHENILHLHYHDPVLEKTVRSFDDLGNSDLMHRYVMRTQQMPLLVYQPSSAISIHYQVAQVQRPNIEWPKSYQRYRITLTEKMDVLKSWQCKIPPYISRHLSIKSFVEDLVSPLLHILSPATLRPVARHLLTERESNDLAHLVSTMVSYALSYNYAKSDHQPSNSVPEVTSDVSRLALDPPISDFVNFKGYKCGHVVLASAMKQVLAHEVEKERILQTSTSRSTLSARDSKDYQDLRMEELTSSELGQKVSAAFCAQRKSENANNIVQNNQILSKTIPTKDSSKNTAVDVRHKSTGNTKKSSTGSRDFFERFRKSSNKHSQTTGTSVHKGASEKVLHPLLFKFNEGFTNAIKRPVRMREFLV